MSDESIKHFITEDAMKTFIKDFEIKDILYMGRMPDKRWCLHYKNPPQKRNNKNNWNFIKR